MDWRVRAARFVHCAGYRSGSPSTCAQRFRVRAVLRQESGRLDHE